MKRLGIVIAVVAFASAVGIWDPWRSRFSRHFNFPLPSSATLINYHHSSGRDFGDEFEFSFTDDALRDAIIREWMLNPPRRHDEVMSFAESTTAQWWPRASLKNLAEKYGRVDQDAAKYWSLWVDRANGKLYVEYGNW